MRPRQELLNSNQLLSLELLLGETEIGLIATQELAHVPLRTPFPSALMLGYLKAKRKDFPSQKGAFFACDRIKRFRNRPFWRRLTKLV